MAPSLQELSTKVDTLNAQVDDKEKEHKDAMEMKDKEHKDAMHEMDEKHKTAMEDYGKKNHDAMEEDKNKHEAILKAVLVAMDEPDKDKRDAMIKTAMIEHKDDEHTQTSMHKGMHEDDEEKKAMKAQLEYQNNIIKKPKLQILEAAYTGVGTDKSKLEEFKADWNKMTLPQLDAAIEMAKPIIELSGKTIETIPSPLSLSNGMSTFTGSVKTDNEYSAKVDKMTVEELFTR